MAEHLAELKKKGGGAMTETVLWTNSSPTASFGPQDITLAEDINNYTYLAIKANPSTTNNNDFVVAIRVADFIKTKSTATDGILDRFGTAAARVTYDYYRPYYYVSARVIHAMDASELSTAWTTNNARMIPIEIIGIK